MTQKYQVKVSMKQAAIVETGIVLKQGDFGMQLEIEVLDFDATGTTPQIVFRKAMGAVESTTITVSGNKYTYTFKGTELDTPGKCFCDLKLKNSTTQRISTASFMFRVVADTLDGLAEESSSYSDTIAQIVGSFDNDIDEIKNAVNNVGYYKNFTDTSLYHTGYPTISGGEITYGEQTWWRSIIVEQNGGFYADVSTGGHFIYLNANTEVVLDKILDSGIQDKIYCEPVSGATRVLVLSNPAKGPNVYKIAPALNINNRYDIFIKFFDDIVENYGYGNSISWITNDTSNPVISIYDNQSKSELNVYITSSPLTIAHNTNLLINLNTGNFETSSSNWGDDTHLFVFRNYVGLMQGGLSLWLRAFKYHNNIETINNQIDVLNQNNNELFNDINNIGYYMNFTDSSLYHTGYPTISGGEITYGEQTWWRSIIVEQNGDFFADITTNGHFIYLNDQTEVVLDRNIGSESINKLYCPPVAGATRVLVLSNPASGPQVYKMAARLNINNRYTMYIKFLDGIEENYGYGKSLKLIAMDTTNPAFSIYDWESKTEKNIVFSEKELTVAHNTNLLVNTTNNTLETSASNKGDDTHIFLFRNYLGIMQDGLSLWLRGFKYSDNIKSINSNIYNLQQDIINKVNVNNNADGKYEGQAISFPNFYHSKYVMYPTDVNGNLITYLQDGAVYKNYLFQFNNKPDNHYMYVIDLQKEKCIAQLNLHTALSQPNAYHNGVVSFTNEFYSADDEFPLIALTESEFDQDSGNYDPTKSGYLYIYRILRNNDDFSLSLIQTITMPKYEDTESKISAVFCDYQSDTMWLIAVCNSGTYSGNSKVRYWKFKKKPYSQGDYTLNLQDSLAYFETPWTFTWQTAAAYGGKVYVIVNYTSGYIYHIKLMVYSEEGTELTTINLEELEMFSSFVTNEPEQLTVYKNAIFVTCRYGIYKLTFD